MAGIRIEVLRAEYYDGARAIQNDFLGARKRACGVIPCACCPNSRLEFELPYRRSPELLALSAVAVREDGTVVGFVQMYEYGLPRGPIEQMMHTLRPGEVYIEMLSVSAEARGQGIGTRLLEWCEATARARHAEVLTLGVVAGNPARRLYERFGFEVEERGICAAICTSLTLCCLIGLPHGECGGIQMEKRL